MLTKDMMQEIQDLKLQGYTPGQIHTRFLEKRGKVPLMPNGSAPSSSRCWAATRATAASQ